MTIVPSYNILIDYTQAEEDALALTLVGAPIGSKIIYNTTLAISRIWDGSIFVDIPVPTEVKLDIVAEKVDELKLSSEVKLDAVAEKVEELRVDSVAKLDIVASNLATFNSDSNTRLDDVASNLAAFNAQSNIKQDQIIENTTPENILFYHNANVNETKNVKSGAGKFKKLIINNPSIGTVTLYDSLTGTGAVIAVIALAGTIPFSIDYNLNFSIGLTYVSASSPGDFTITYT